jgi:hypothetical protein
MADHPKAQPPRKPKPAARNPARGADAAGEVEPKASPTSDRYHAETAHQEPDRSRPAAGHRKLTQ